ncbi:class I SAM-dependent rRNA methyltransferase [Symmachiella macrocystis]|nr:class I SAM-dependent rRNA methyltransferase [Symmachiella macrocystis]
MTDNPIEVETETTIAAEADSAPTALPVVVIKKRRALPFFSRHPWVFTGAIARVDGDPPAGAEVQVVTDSGEFIARGLFNPHSNIRVRLYSWRADCAVDDAFLSERLDAALALRRDVLDRNQAESACRLVASEADGLSGLTVDRYGQWLVLQLTSFALAERRDVIVRLLKEKLSPAGILLRTEKGIRDAEGLQLTDGLLEGEAPPSPMFIEEYGVRYGLDLLQGQKTGFYLDQRDNRAAFAKYTAGRSVLDLFCYTGGFGLSAMVNGGARGVLGVDASEAALKIAQANAELNGVADRMTFEKGDAFRVLDRLREEGQQFGAVVLDPPKMARHRSAVPSALKGYAQLNRAAMELLSPNGILVTCSCSGLVTRADFEAALAKAAIDAGRNLQILETRGPAADHPASVFCPENHYLDCYICRVE